MAYYDYSLTTLISARIKFTIEEAYFKIQVCLSLNDQIVIRNNMLQEVPSSNPGQHLLCFIFF